MGLAFSKIIFRGSEKELERKYLKGLLCGNQRPDQGYAVDGSLEQDLVILENRTVYSYDRTIPVLLHFCHRHRRGTSCAIQARELDPGVET